ncbi:uncharacterized protein LOC126891143 [Diabrotica virgifera virgifera]|uniref:CCHC-type domain-containing protein n=1 Tax=Diabrotica virgifera virgifera TaxID=50390 RepID=A0ABM5L1G5_DIAVI|nr:uncharacterized protein LOC126891143 [Diabrotica virgifera virgifera]
MSETENYSQVSNVERYKRKRVGLKSKLTIFKNYITDVESNISNDDYNTPSEEIKLRLNKAVDLLDNFDEIQSEIGCHVNDLEEEASQRELFEKDYFSIITKTRSLLSKANPNEVMYNINSENDVQSQARPSSRPNVNCNIKLPTLQLLKYSGSYEKWLEYRDSFQSIIMDNSDINPIQKFHYLNSSLSGVAEKVISNLLVSLDNFSVALQMLCERFANKDLLIYNHTKCLFSFPKITKPSASSIRQLIDELQGNLRSLKSLNQPIDTWDTLLIFIIIEKLDSYTTQEWESKKPSNATLKDLINFLKGKADVLEKIDANLGQNNKERFSSDKKSSRALVATQTSCAFCKSINNKISLCPDFNHLSISDRAENVKRLKLCFNCQHSGHINLNCKHGKCTKCGKKHHSLLHINTDNSNNLTSYSNSVQSSSNIQSDSTVHNTQTLSNYVPEYKSVLLSTVLVNVFDSAGVAHKCRALLDSASQSNYIVSSFF